RRRWATLPRNQLPRAPSPRAVRTAALRAPRISHYTAERTTRSPPSRTLAASTWTGVRGARSDGQARGPPLHSAPARTTPGGDSRIPISGRERGAAGYTDLGLGARSSAGGLVRRACVDD